MYLNLLGVYSGLSILYFDDYKLKFAVCHADISQFQTNTAEEKNKNK